MKNTIRYLILIFTILLSLSIHSVNQKHKTSLQLIKGYEVIEFNINKSASALSIAQPSIQWSENKNGNTVARIEYKNNKVEIPFTSDEISSAAHGHISSSTTKRINKILSTLPGGGGPIQ